MKTVDKFYPPVVYFDGILFLIIATTERALIAKNPNEKIVKLFVEEHHLFFEVTQTTLMCVVNDKLSLYGLWSVGSYPYHLSIKEKKKEEAPYQLV